MIRTRAFPTHPMRATYAKIQLATIFELSRRGPRNVWKNVSPRDGFEAGCMGPV